MKRYVCSMCGYVYDPEFGVADNDVPPGTSFESLPQEWVCPKCGAPKRKFVPERPETSLTL